MGKTCRSLLLTALVLLTLLARVSADDPPWIARGTAGMVASDSPEASRIGADVLKAGGNAFDAAVAASFALTVARPESTGLGGGGFMLAYVAAEKRFVALDFRESAPAAATAERYAKLHAERGDGPSPSVYGGNAVGVPGQLAGLTEINKRFGTRPLAELVRPAIELANTGFVADAHYRAACVETLKVCEKRPQLKQTAAVLYASLLGDGTPPEVGAKIRRPDLAVALELIAKDGSAAIYGGPVGEAIVRAVNAAGGALTLDDLRGFRVKERTPIRARVGKYEIVAMPPPSSGGACLIEALNILHCTAERSSQNLAELRAAGRYPAALVTALRHAFADRARWFGDPDFAAVPVASLINRDYARRLAEKQPQQIDDYGSTKPPDDSGTSHFCIADRQGNVVALTETVNDTFGSLLVAEPFGIVLNDEMDDFTTNPGQPNLFGLVQGQSNAVAPGKRPLSSMSPTIVLKDGRPVLVLGGSGGPRIITAVLQVMLNVLEFELPLADALAAIRLHNQWQPDEVYFDRAPPPELVAALEKAGVKISEQRKDAAVQAIQFLPDGKLIGGSDPAKGGRPAALP